MEAVVSKLPISSFEALFESIVPKMDERSRVRAALSFHNANRRERRRRMAWAMRFMDEYRRVCSINTFGTAFMLTDIEHVIEADILALQEDLPMWSYADDETLLRNVGPLHAPWKALLEEYLAETDAMVAGLGEA